MAPIRRRLTRLAALVGSAMLLSACAIIEVDENPLTTFEPAGPFADQIATVRVEIRDNTHAQSIDPDNVTRTMAVGETIVIDKTITLSAAGASLVDLFFLADNTGSMGGIINQAEAGASSADVYILSPSGDMLDPGGDRFPAGAGVPRCPRRSGAISLYHIKLLFKKRKLADAANACRVCLQSGDKC